MSRSKLVWKAKRQNNKTKNNHKQTQYRYKCKEYKISWKPCIDLRFQRIKEFVTFFTSSYHKKQDMVNCDIYIDQLLQKLDNNDRSILLNLNNNISQITHDESSDIYNLLKNKKLNFSPLSHCIFAIGKSWKYSNNKYQQFVINKYIKLIKLLIKYGSNPFQCIYCFKVLNIYDQYCCCNKRVKPSFTGNIDIEIKNKKHIKGKELREMFKLHSTPFKHLCLFFRQDLDQTVDDRKIKKKNQTFWWSQNKKKEKIKYKNVHKAIFEILQFILNEYDMTLPLIRLQFKKIRKRRCKLIEPHIIFPVFPSYYILYNLLSIDRVYPFSFVTLYGDEIDSVYTSMDNQSVIDKLSPDHYDKRASDPMKTDFPLNWSVPLLFTMQQIEKIKILNAILCVQPILNAYDNITGLIIEYSYFSKYDKLFGETITHFLSDSDNIQRCILLMNGYNIFSNNNIESKYTKYIPFKYRTSNYVMASWLNVLKNIKYNETYDVVENSLILYPPFHHSLDDLLSLKQDFLLSEKVDIIYWDKDSVHLQGILDCLSSSGQFKLSHITKGRSTNTNNNFIMNRKKYLNLNDKKQLNVTNDCCWFHMNCLKSMYIVDINGKKGKNITNLVVDMMKLKIINYFLFICAFQKDEINESPLKYLIKKEIKFNIMHQNELKQIRDSDIMYCPFSIKMSSQFVYGDKQNDFEYLMKPKNSVYHKYQEIYFKAEQLLKLLCSYKNLLIEYIDNKLKIEKNVEINDKKQGYMDWDNINISKQIKIIKTENRTV